MAESARNREKEAFIQADIALWKNAGHGEEMREEAVDLIRGCMQRKDQTLHLAYLGLSSLPESVCELTHLNELALDHNNLTNLPLALNKLRNLQRVDVSHNKMTVFPDNLLTLPSLRSLKASNNQITDFPIALGTVSTLQNIQLDGNRVEAIPHEIFDLNAGLTIFIHDNPISETDAFMISTRQKRTNYQGPAIFQREFDGRCTLAYEKDPFSMMSGLEKIEALVGSAEKMSDGRYEAPVNFREGGRNMNKKECLLMALEISLASHQKLTPALSYRILHDLPSDTTHFLVNSVTFERDRIKSWSDNEELPVAIRVAREVIQVESSMRETGEGIEQKQDQNVHDHRVHENFVTQLGLIESQVEVPVSPETAKRDITMMINGLWNDRPEDQRDAAHGLELVISRYDLARGFKKSPAHTLALLWTYIDGQDGELKASLHDALLNRLAEIGSGHICALGITERVIDIPTAVDWSVTNSISFEHLHTEIAKMASDVNEEFEEKFGGQADLERDRAARSINASSVGDAEQRINEIKRDMFVAKANVELVTLRNLDEGLVSSEIDKIFVAAVMRERI